MSDATQVLLILDRHSVGESELSDAGWRVSQQASDRIIVCEDVGTGDPDALRTMPGVTLVTGDVDVSRASPPLDEAEALFAHAWLERTRSLDDPRPGDGLDWDSPGFTPPDPPAG